MSLALFSVNGGMDDGLKYYLSGVGAPSSSDTTYTDPAPVGSQYQNVSNGDFYIKTTEGNGTDKWRKLGDASDLTNVQNEVDAIEVALGGSFNTTTNLFSNTIFSGNTYLNDATSYTDALSQLDVAAKSIQDELDVTQAGAGLNPSGTYSAPTTSNYLASATTLKGADSLLDSAIKAVSDVANAAVMRAGDTMTGSLVMSAGTHITLPDAPVNGTDAVNLAYVQGKLGGLSWKNSVKATTTSNVDLVTGGLVEVDGYTPAAGDRILVKDQSTPSQNGIYVAASGAWVRSTDLDSTSPIDEVNGAAVYVENGTAQSGTGWTVTTPVSAINVDSIVWTQFNGASGITAGVGLSKVGNVLNINLGAGITELPTDEVAIDVRANSGLILTEDGSTSSTASSAKLAVLLDGATLSMSAAGLRVGAPTIQRITDLETEANNLEASLGEIVNSNGVYQGFTGTNYLDGNSSITQDLTDLDAKAKSLQDQISAITDPNGSGTQAELDKLEAAIGSVFNTTTNLYNPFTNVANGTTYINGNTTITGDLIDLDVQLKTTTDALAAEVTRASDEEGFIRAFVGKTAAGSEMPTYSATNYVAQSSSLETAIGALDAALKTATSGGSTTQTELDALEVTLGTGGVDGSSLVAWTSTNYIGSATTFAAAINSLDAALKAQETAGNNEDTYQNSFLGKTAGNSLPSYSSVTHIANNDSIVTAIGKLDAAIADFSNAEIAAIEASVGLNSDGTFTTWSGTNWLDGITTIKAGITALDTEIGANVSNGYAILAANKVNGNITALDTRLSNIATSLDGFLKADGTWNGFTGTKVLDSATSVNDALVRLDTSLNNSVTPSVVNNVTNQTIIDSVKVDDVESAMWIYTVTSVATASKKVAGEVLAVHNGTALSDATNASFTLYATLKTSGNIPGLVVQVVLSGTGASQVMSLVVQSTDAVNVRATRVRVAA